MIKLNKINKSLVAAITGLFVMSTIITPIVGTAFAADLNQGSQPYSLLSGTNKNGSTNWEDSVDVEIGEGLSLLVYLKNTSGESANNVNVTVDFDIDSNGQGATASVEVEASNAPTKTDSISLDLTGGGELTGFGYAESVVRDAAGNYIPVNNKQNVVSSGGVDIGNIGENGIRYFIIDFYVNGDTNGGGSGDKPDVTTQSATNVDEDSARLNCKVEPNGEDTEVWFEWGEGDSESDLDHTTNSADIDGNDSSETVFYNLSGLDEDTEYVFRCVGESSEGETEGNLKTFNTDGNGGSNNNGNDPQVTTLSATSIDSTSATLRCDVDPNGEDTDAWFEWGTSSTNLNRDTSHEDVGDGDRTVNHSSRITGLSVNTNYFYRCLADNSEGDDTGSVRSFRTIAPITNVVTRFVDVFRTVQVEPEPEPQIEALIITLNADSVNADNGTIEYNVSYDNRTSLFLRNVELTVDLPSELNFIDSRPNPSRDLGDQLVYNIGRVEAGEQGSFLIETELARNVDSNDLIRLVAHVEYNDDSSILKIVEVIDENTYGELIGNSNLTANILTALRNFFTSPILWLILFIGLIVFVIRYLFAARSRRDTSLV